MGAGDLHARRNDACMDYDVAVLGLGGMGSAVAAHAARRGLRVAGFERFALVHDLGSSAGRTRIIRKAYFEDAAYVPLLDRAYMLWRELEESSQTALLDLFGVLMVGPAGIGDDHGRCDKPRQCSTTLPCEQLDAGAASRALSATRVSNRAKSASIEPDAGVVFPERAIAAYLTDARGMHGAQLYDRRARSRLRNDGDRVRVTFDGGEHVDAARVAVCAGAWSSDLLAQLHLPLARATQRPILVHPASGAGGPARVPAFFLERASLPAPLYGIPDLGDGLKVAFHGYGETTQADQLDREVHAGEDRADARDARNA